MLTPILRKPYKFLKTIARDSHFAPQCLVSYNEESRLSGFHS
jgi:hypothetical protein